MCVRVCGVCACVWCVCVCVCGVCACLLPSDLKFRLKWWLCFWWCVCVCARVLDSW